MRSFTTLPQENLAKVGPAAQAIEADGLHRRQHPGEQARAVPVAGRRRRRDQAHRAAHRRRHRLRPLAHGRGQCRLGPRLELRRRTRDAGHRHQVRAHNERRFSVPWSAPAPRIREYVQAVRAIWAAWKGDGKLNYEGKHYRFTLMTPNFVPEPYDGPLPRLGVAAVGPVMLKVAAEESDDVKLHSFCTRQIPRGEHHADPHCRAWPQRAAAARASRSRAAASSSPARTTRRSPSCSTGCAIAWPSTARRRPTGRCSRSMGWAISAASSTP